MSLNKAIDKKNIKELRKPHSLEDLDSAINYANDKKKFAFIDTSSSLTEEDYDQMIKIMNNNKNELILNSKEKIQIKTNPNK